jgi:hypothetical protein
MEQKLKFEFFPFFGNSTMENSNLKIVLMILISIFEIWVLKNAKKVLKSIKNDKKMKFKIFDFLAISTTENTNFDIKVLT